MRCGSRDCLSLNITLSATIAGILALAPWTIASAGKANPILCVPCAKVRQDIVVACPTSQPMATVRGQLIEVDRPGAPLAADLVPAIQADGTPSATARRLIAAIPPQADACAVRRFRFDASQPSTPTPAFSFKQIDDKSLGLWEGDRPVLVYNFGVITGESVPVTDSRRNRACFVHPLYGLNGEVLTDAFPRDHYHHVGLFWSWPHVRIDGQEYDLWTYRNIQHRFVRWLGRETGTLCAVLGVENGWFVGDKKVMTERVWLTVHRAGDAQRAIDMRLALLPTDKPVELWGAAGKSYGGLNIRYAPSVAELKARQAAPPADTKRPASKPKAAKPKATPAKPADARPKKPAVKSPPRPKDTFITVPDGLTGADLPDTRLPWADLVREFPGAGRPSGAAVFIDPRHPDYPPTWLTRHYGVLCIGWPGVNPKTLNPHQPTTLDYRVWIHQAAVDVKALKEAYDTYTAGARAEWK